MPSPSLPSFFGKAHMNPENEIPSHCYPLVENQILSKLISFPIPKVIFCKEFPSLSLPSNICFW